MGILSVNLNNINLDNNFDEDDPDTIILIKLLAQHSKFKKRKALKKDKGKINASSVASERWWNFCLSEDDKKEIKPIFTE